MLPCSQFFLRKAWDEAFQCVHDNVCGYNIHMCDIFIASDIQFPLWNSALVPYFQMNSVSGFPINNKK